MTMLKTREEVENWLKTYEIKNYTINVDLSVNVDGGYFNCVGNKILSLVGCPESVGGGLNCNDNKLISLKGCPVEIGGVFDCGNNKLTSLLGVPKSIVNIFSCSNNQLISLVVVLLVWVVSFIVVGIN